MKGLIKLAFFGGLGAYAWKSYQSWKADRDQDDRGAVGSSGIVRDAGPQEQQGIDNDNWDIVDERSDESFPASDPPGNY